MMKGQTTRIRDSTTNPSVSHQITHQKSSQEITANAVNIFYSGDEAVSNMFLVNFTRLWE